MAKDSVGLESYKGTPIAKSFIGTVDVMDYLDGFMKAVLGNERMEKAIEKREDVSPADKKRAVKEYGDVEYADEKNKKYPLDPKHIQAALSYWGQAENRAKYSPEEQKTIGRRIGAAARRLGKDTDLGKEKE